MFDYKNYFDKFCRDNQLKLSLSYDMPKGYETANGMFDVATKILYVNREMLKDFSDFEQCFFLFHELRHGIQYLCPSQFDDKIIKSLQYVIMFDGTCYKLVDGEYLECILQGDEEYFSRLYKGQPYEVDANKFAYEQVKGMYGFSRELQELYDFWMPTEDVDWSEYEELYSLIDKKLGI